MSRTPEQLATRAAWQREWARTHPEEVRALRRLWRERHPDKEAERNRTRVYPPGAKAAAQRRWRASHPEAARKASRESQARQRAAHPERFVAQRAARRTTVVEVIHPLDVFERDGWVCRLCGRPVDRGATERRWQPSIDHIVPLSKGGTHVPANVQLAHRGCNSAKGARP